MMRRIMWILWPSFIVGAVGEMIFFAFFDPADLPFSDTAIGQNRIMVYSVGFFIFWLFAAVSSALTCFLQLPSSQLNRSSRCPQDGQQEQADDEHRA